MASFATLAILPLGLSLAACGGDDEPKPSGVWVIHPDADLPAGDASSPSWDGPDASGPSCNELEGGAPDSICACTFDAAADFTASNEAMVAFTNKYEPRCMRVKAGTIITWTGNFAAHPLWPSACAGDVENNPIHDVADVAATSLDIAFPEPGTFPYYCPDHASDGRSPSGMCGVVYVVP
jgi:plastocyanin